MQITVGKKQRVGGRRTATSPGTDTCQEKRRVEKNDDKYAGGLDSHNPPIIATGTAPRRLPGLELDCNIAALGSRLAFCWVAVDCALSPTAA